MFSKEEIMTMMQEGKTSEEIAAAFANALNEAETETKRIDEEARAKADAEAVLAARHAKKLDDMRYLVEAIFDYFHEWYPELDETLQEAIKDIDDDEEIEDLVKIIDAYVELYQSMKKMETTIFGTIPSVANIAPNTKTSPGNTDINIDIPNLNNVFEKFFNNNIH